MKFLRMLGFPLLAALLIILSSSWQFKKGGDLPTGFNDLFAGSGECILCHNSMENAAGESVSIVADWRSSMMAHAARDPLWRAKVSHETLINPGLQQIIEDKCIKCHAPLGHLNAHYNGQEYYSITEMENDPLAMDGVQCTVCHQITPESLGNYSGNMIIDDTKIIYGPYENPFGQPMFNNTGYTPVHGPHIEDSRLCGSCHTLLTPTVDLEGNLTGGEFVEQAIYQEWDNSIFPEQSITCQACHIPRIDDPVVISTIPPWLEPESPFGMHHLAGANVFMQKIFKEYGDELGVTAFPENYDSTIARNYRMLQHHSIEIEMTELSRTADSILIDVSLINKAGHKFPAGFPSRRIFIELVAVNTEVDTLFHSGKMDNEYNLIYEDENYEQHHNVISEEEQVQLYEMIIGDVNGDVTTILLRGATHLKDNRLPPEGFTSAHNNYDTAFVAGLAVSDVDFNKDNGIEGTGKDIVHYHIPVNGYAGNITISARVFYQTVSNRWLLDMLNHTSNEIDLFRGFYETADKAPILIEEAEITSTSTGLNDLTEPDIHLFPNPTTCKINISCVNPIDEVMVFQINGSPSEYLLLSDTQHNKTIKLLQGPGIYFIQVVAGVNKVVKKVIVQNR